MTKLECLWTISLFIRMMEFHVRNGRDARNRQENGDAPRCFYSAIQQHDRPLDSGVAHCLFRIRACVLGFDQCLRSDLPLGILRHARSARTTEFQTYSDDLRRGHALREFLLLFPFRTGEFLRVRDGSVVIVFADCDHAPDVCAFTRGRTPPGNGLHPLWPALRPVALQFHDQNSLCRTAVGHRCDHGAILLPVSNCGHEVQRHGRVPYRQCHRAASADSTYQSKENMGRIFWCDGIFAAGESGAFQIDARTSLRVELDPCHHFGTAAWFLGGDRRSGRIDHQAQHKKIPEDCCRALVEHSTWSTVYFSPRRYCFFICAWWCEFRDFQMSDTAELRCEVFI